MKIYIGNNNIAKEIKEIYYSLENKAKKIIAIYIGGNNNKAKCILDNHIENPKMISSNLPFGEATASTVRESDASGDYFAWKAFDGDPNTCWSTPLDKSVNQTCQYDFKYYIIPTKITVTTKGSTGNNSRKFTIQASKDGTTWVILTTNTGTSDLTNKEYTYTTTESYRYFQFKTHSSATSANSYKQLYTFKIEGKIE